MPRKTKGRAWRFLFYELSHDNQWNEIETANHLKNKLYAIFFSIVSFLSFIPVAASQIPTGTYLISAPKAVYTLISGQGWAYSVPGEVKHVREIEKLIQCESKGVNLSEPDSDGIYSDGILQFHRNSKSGSVGSGTWAWMSSLSGIKGNPTVPADAIIMTDWAISHGLVSQWSCAYIKGLVK